MMKPGINSSTFEILFSEDYFGYGKKMKLEVLEKPKRTFKNRILSFLRIVPKVYHYKARIIK